MIEPGDAELRMLMVDGDPSIRMWRAPGLRGLPRLPTGSGLV
jgi:hypothetical protein